MAQSLHDIEIILVDDGSPDRCGEIAEEYAIKDNRVKVIHQKNSGLGPARNTGMAAATGEYIGFVDSDDWANNCMFERLYNAAKKNNADIAVGGHCDWREGKVIRSKRHPLAGKTVMDRSEIDEIRRNLYGRSIDDGGYQCLIIPKRIGGVYYGNLVTLSKKTEKYTSSSKK